MLTTAMSLVSTLLSVYTSSASSSLLYPLLAALLVLALQPLLSLSSPTLFSRRPRLHLQRRVQHITTNLLLTYLCTTPHLFTPHTTLLTLSTTAALLLTLHSLRHHIPRLNSAFIAACGSLLRPRELTGLPSGYWNVVSVLCCVGLSEAVPSVVSMRTVQLCLLYEAVGDPIAAIVGTTLSSTEGVAGKTTVGSVGMMIACSVVTAVYLIANHLPVDLWWLIVPPAVCALVERYTGRAVGCLHIDDNFTVPVVTCIVVSLLQSTHTLSKL